MIYVNMKLWFYMLQKVLSVMSKYKRYGHIKIGQHLKINLWYDLEYNVVDKPSSEKEIEVNTKNTGLENKYQECDTQKSFDIQEYNKTENKTESYKNIITRNKKTLDKIAMKKNKKRTKCFRIREINPATLHKIYSLKCNKKINYITNSCLALLQFYMTSNTLVFDKIKGLLVFSLLYKTDAITVHRKDKQQCFDTLKYLENKKVEFIEDDNDLSFDTVIVAGEYNDFMQKYKKNIKNLVLFYIKYRKEAEKLFYELFNDSEFIDVSMFDFFTREWQIYENIRPQMNCDLRCGFIVRAIKIKK